MNVGGWVFMLTSLGLVLGLLGWCLWRVLAHHNSSGSQNSPRR